MQIIVVTDSYAPLRTSAAVQLRDLANAFRAAGVDVLVVAPSTEIDSPWLIEVIDGTTVLRVNVPQTKTTAHIRRVFAEFVMPFAMIRALKQSKYLRKPVNGVVWYSPSIFHGPLVRFVKNRSGARSYLILRDVFPEWALNTGVMRRGPAYLFFKLVEAFQYSVADAIGVQSVSNLPYLRKWAARPNRQLEVLQNWVAPAQDRGCPIRIDQTSLAGRKIFVYAGNMGVAQGMDGLLQLVIRLKDHTEIGFLFVGRGSEVERLRATAHSQALGNLLVQDEIDPTQVPGLYAQCHIGLVSLDLRHKTHNVPGKFLTYLQAGLPVLAIVNPGNDLIRLIEDEKVGTATSVIDPETLSEKALALAAWQSSDPALPDRCRALCATLFSPETAVQQIMIALALNR